MNVNEPPTWTAHAPTHDASMSIHTTITDRGRRVVAATAATRAVVALPQLSVASEPEADLVIAELLGQGGMGVVHVARQRALGREVAVKRLRPEAATRAAAISALLIEAELQGGLDHPNVVPVHALGRDANDLPVLVMKRLSGVPWRALIRDPDHPAWPKGVGDKLTFHIETLMQVCNAVHFAHSRGVIHRDIKPDNVMLGAFGEVYLLDWGIAYRPLPGDAVDPTIVGTPAYVAPEMLQGSGPHLTPQTDVYLLGATLHEVLTGHVRHRGETILEGLFSAAASAAFDYPKTVPAELAALCNRAMSRDPAARPESALALRQALADFLRHRGSNALAEAAVLRLAELRAAPAARGEGDRGADLAIRALFSEASFGFRQALLAWDSNAAAREGLTEALTWMIGYELSHRNAEAAAALLAELPAAPAELAAQLEIQRTELSRERADLSRLREVERDLDPVVSFRPRLYAMMLCGLLVSGLTLAVWMRSPAGPSHAEIILVFCAGIMCLLSSLVARRRSLLANQINRQVVGIYLLLFLMLIADHVIAQAAGLSVATAILLDLLISATICAMSAITIHWSFWIAMPVLFVSALVVARFPHLALPMAAFASLLGMSTVGLTGWLILGRKESDPLR